MTKAESAALIASLVTAFPSARFAEENAEMYESGIADLGAEETQLAIGELIHSERFLPSIAAIRQEVMRQRRQRSTERDNAKRLALVRGDGSRIGPYPEQWKPSLDRLLESGSRYRRMAEAWYASLGKAASGDPAAPFIEIARSGTSGNDVRERVLSTVLPAADVDETERRYP